MYSSYRVSASVFPCAGAATCGWAIRMRAKQTCPMSDGLAYAASSQFRDCLAHKDHERVNQCLGFKTSNQLAAVNDYLRENK